MLTIVVGLPASGKTTWVRSWDLPKPSVWFAEVQMDYKGQALYYRPDIYDLMEAEAQYESIVIDHQLRIKGINSIKARERIVEYIEQSKKHWIIIAHSLKGITDDLNIWSMRWGSGFIETADFVFGVAHRDRNKGMLINVLKQRYMAFKTSEYRLDLPDYYKTIKEVANGREVETIPTNH